MKDLLIKILQDKENRDKLISEFQISIWNGSDDDDILINLAHDLEFYVSNEEHRKEDPSYFGDEKLEEVIFEALKDLD